MSDLVEIFVTETAEEVTLNVTPNLIEVNVIKGIAPTNPITGTGTTNFLPKFTGGSTLGNSIIFESGNSIGIGTTLPTSYTNYSLLEINNTTGGGLRLKNSAATAQFEVIANSSETYIKNVNNVPMWFGTNNSEALRITSSGNVGIGTTSPTSRLHVVGLPSFADNTTAIAGGLTLGAFYHTAGVLKVVI